MEILIRDATSADATLLADFNARMALETENRRLEPERLLQGVEALLGDPAKGSYFVAEAERGGASTVAGQLLLTYEWSDWRNGQFWWIQSVYVAPEFRAKGIFRALFQHIQALAKTRDDVCGLRLYVDAENESARATYERLGLKRTNYEFFELDFVFDAHSRASPPS